MQAVHTGAAAQKLWDQEEQRRAIRQAHNRGMWRFRLKDGEEAEITFVDGELNAHGVLEPYTFREHRVKMGGSFGHIQCTMEIEGECPNCETGNEPSTCGAYTIIDHRKFKTKEGKVRKDQPRLFVFYAGTKKLLQKLAVTNGGLVGLRVHVSRSGAKSPAVGNAFSSLQKGDFQTLRKTYWKIREEDKKKVTIFKPAEYDKEIPLFTSAQLREQGFGAKVVGKEQPLDDDDFIDDEATDTDSIEDEV